MDLIRSAYHHTRDSEIFSIIPSPRCDGERVRVRGSNSPSATMRGTQPWKTNRARTLRSGTTSAEDKLWHHLRDRRLGGFKFVRQLPIEKYFADFACREKRLAVEIDGATHGTPSELASDRARTRTLGALGYKVVRVQNIDIYENIESVLAHLLALLEKRDA